MFVFFWCPKENKMSRLLLYQTVCISELKNMFRNVYVCRNKAYEVWEDCATIKYFQTNELEGRKLIINATIS